MSLTKKFVQNANFIIPDEEGKILIVERFCKKSLLASGQDNPNHPSVEKWHDLPGGKVDEGHSHIQTIKDEAEQELGIIPKDVIHWSTMPNPAPNADEHSTRDLYILPLYEGVPVNKAGHEEGHIRVYSVLPNEVPSKVGAKIDFATSCMLMAATPECFQNLRQNSNESEASTLVPVP